MLNLGFLVFMTVFLLMIFAIVYPVTLLFISSFDIAEPGFPSKWGLGNWRAAFDDTTLWISLWNTVTTTAARGLIGWPIGILIAWLLARTNVPWRNGLEFLFWISFFLPSLAVVQAWILLLHPQAGLINSAIVYIFPFVDSGPFNIYSFWGITWSHLWANTIAIKVILLTPAFRHMDSTLEEASRITGATTLQTLRKVTIPAIMPAIVVTIMLSIIHSFQAFEIELVLGQPDNFNVFGTKIFNLLLEEPPLFGSATALSMMVLAGLMPMIVFQRWVTTRRHYTTVSGQYKSQVLDLRKWRWVIFGIIILMALGQTLVPIVLIVTGTFMKFYGWFNIPEPWTLRNWSQIMQDTTFLSSLKNTLIFAIGSATVSVVVFALVGYIIVRTKFFARGFMDLLSWGTAALPGIIVGLAWLWVILGNPFLQPLYGTIGMLIIATSLGNIALGVNLMKANFIQLGAELEEASRVSGAGGFYTFRKVVLPLVAPMLAVLFVLGFVSAARNISTVALLATSDLKPLAFLQLEYMTAARNEAGAVVGVIVIALSVGVAMVARVFGLRLTSGERSSESKAP
jgi:iron(III) transport system permease protein